MRRFCLVALMLGASARGQAKPDVATAAWWAQTTALANDGMEGRDTGTDAYERAAKYVAAQFAAAGLKPAGEGGTFFQRVAMHEVRLDAERSTVRLVPRGGMASAVRLRLLQEVTVAPRAGMVPEVSGELVFVGYGMPEAGAELRGKVAVFFNNTPRGLSASERDGFASRRAKLLGEAGVVATVSIDNPAATEPTHWPAAYARTVTPGVAPVSATGAPVALRVSAEAAGKLFAEAKGGMRFAEVLAAGEKGEALKSMDLGVDLELRLVTAEKEISSPNVLGVLPGSDPKMAGEYVAVSAHLDGYGYGTPVLGDRLYNGALDDAAYVATLIELAKSLQGKAPKRSLLFCVFAAEEKGLLGSAYFTAHPTVTAGSIVADLNLDQLRPIFPLKILTMEGLSDSTLGETARVVASKYGIAVRPDREPERNLFRRADNYNFVRIGVPIASFIFGYDPGSPEEVTYRDWYARRYHKPQDDLQTPIDWTAAGMFNRFYGELAVTVANAPVRPSWVTGSPYAQKVAAGR